MCLPNETAEQVRERARDRACSPRDAVIASVASIPPSTMTTQGDDRRHDDTAFRCAFAVRPQSADRIRRCSASTMSGSRRPTPWIRATGPRQQNPLGKIPVLITEDGTAYYDSRVILEYLDDRAGGGKIIPRDAGRALRRAAPAGAVRRHSRCVDSDGLRGPLAAGRRSTKPNGWITRPARSTARSPCWKRRRRRSGRPGLPHVGQIALACALGYRDFRFGGSWRDDHPRLVAWLDDFAARVPAFAATAVKP